MIVAISGTPGTGKTAVGKELKKLLGWRVANLNTLAKQKNCFTGFDKKRNCSIVDTEKLEKLIKSISGDLVIESHYAHDISNDLTFILTCKTNVLDKRLKKRRWSQKKIQENLQAEIMEICLSEAHEQKRVLVSIDTTQKSPKAVAQIIKREILKHRK